MNGDIFSAQAKLYDYDKAVKYVLNDAIFRKLRLVEKFEKERVFCSSYSPTRYISISLGACLKFYPTRRKTPSFRTGI